MSYLLAGFIFFLIVVLFTETLGGSSVEKNVHIPSHTASSAINSLIQEEKIKRISSFKLVQMKLNEAVFYAIRIDSLTVGCYFEIKDEEYNTIGYTNVRCIHHTYSDPREYDDKLGLLKLTKLSHGDRLNMVDGSHMIFNDSQYSTSIKPEQVFNDIYKGVD